MELERVREYFFRQGLSEIEPSELRHLEFKPSLAFTDGKNRIFVNVFPVGSLTSRNALIKFMMETAALREQCNKIYVVIPKLMATVIDSELLRDMGIGLIVYSGREIKEVVKARELKPKVPVDIDVLEEIKQISGKLKMLEDMISRLEFQVEKIAEEVSKIKVVRVAAAAEEKVVAEDAEAPKVEAEGLPSYMRDNPWLEILRQRGSE